MTKYAVGRKALGICDVCGFSCRLHDMRPLSRNGQVTGVKACPECWEVDHPQYQVGKLRVVDSQTLRDPRPDSAEYAASRAQITPVSGIVSFMRIGQVIVSAT